MPNGNRIDRIWKYYNAFRGYTILGENRVALLLLKKTKEKFKNIPEKINEKSIYETMLGIADELDVNNPFSNSNDFFNSFNALNDEIDWETILASEDPKEAFYVPKVLIYEFEKHFKSNTNTVLIPEAEKFVPYLSDMIDSHSGCVYLLTTMNHVCKLMLDEIFLNHENVRVELTSIYEYEFSAKKFDLILTVPIFGARDRADNNGIFMCREYEMIAVENLLLHLNSEGELVIVLPARITFGVGRVKELREFVQSMYKLEEIAELPAGIFPTTAIKTYMFVITTGRTEDVIIKRYESDVKNPKRDGINKLILLDDTFVMEEELQEMGDWNIDRIFTMLDEDWQRYQNSGIKKEELGNVAEVFRGKAVNKKDINGNIGVVNISNLREYDIDYDGMDHLEEEERKVNNYLLKEGDLLMPARGTVIRTAIFHEQKYPCIASSNIIVIRPDEKLLSGTFLKIFLDSSMGNKILGGKQQGTIVINISYKDLKSLEIPLPTYAEQKEIAEEYIQELSKYLEGIRSVEDRWGHVVNNLQNKFM